MISVCYQADSLQSIAFTQALKNKCNEQYLQLFHKSGMFNKNIELCYCGQLFDKLDRQAYRNYRPDNHFDSRHHMSFTTTHEYCETCKSYELKNTHDCFNPMCYCGERYSIIHDFWDQESCFKLHAHKSYRHHLHVIFGVDYFSS